MTLHAMTLDKVEMEVITPNKLRSLIYDTRVVPTSGEISVELRQSGTIVISLKTEFDNFNINFLLKREEALAIVSALVAAIKAQESAQ